MSVGDKGRSDRKIYKRHIENEAVGEISWHQMRDKKHSLENRKLMAKEDGEDLGSLSQGAGRCKHVTGVA